VSPRRFLPSLRRGAPTERKAAVDRRHSAGPNYAFQGTPYMPTTDLELDRVIREQWERDIWVWRAVDARAKNAASIDVVVKNGRGRKGEVIEPHPISGLLNGQANPYESALAFRWRLQMLLDLSVSKGAFVEVTENRMGPARFDILNPLSTWPVPHPDKFVERFEMRLPDGEVFDELQPYEYGKGGVLWFKRPHPTDPYQSTSWLRAAGISVDLDYWARRYNLNFLFNDGRPGGILAIKSGDDSEYDGIDEADAAVLQQRVSGGPDSAGKVAVLEAEHLEFHDLSMSPRDAQYVEGRAITQREILVAAGTPLSVIGDASGRTFDNADAEAESFWKKEMRPELRLQANTWEKLTPGGLADTSEVVDYDWSQVPELARDERLRDARLLEEVKGGTRSIDSFLEATGREVLDLPGTRVLWFDSGKAPIGDPADITALLTQGQSPPPPAAEPGTELPPGEGEPPALGPAPGGSEPDDIVDAELVDPLDEEQYATKALRGLPAGLAERRRTQHGKLIDRWSEATATEVRSLLERQRKVVLSRLKGAKARRHTRHWDYGPAGPKHDLKALDPAYIVERRTWIDQAIESLVAVVTGAFGAAGESTAKQLGVDYEAAAERTRGEIIARTVRLIAEGLDARAGRLQEIITDLDAEGASVMEIADAVTDAYGSADTWADVTSRSVVGAMNASSLITATNAGAVAKRWLATDDERTRPTHHDAEGQVVPISAAFEVGDAELQFPQDPTGALDEIINCRCTMLFALGKPDGDAELDEDLADLDEAEAEWKARAPGSFARVNVSFDPDDHPRDHRGRFLDVPDVTLPDGTRGVAVSEDSRGNVVVARADGGVETVRPSRLTPAESAEPSGAAPKKPSDWPAAFTDDQARRDYVLRAVEADRATVKPGRSLVTGRSADQLLIDGAEVGEVVGLTAPSEVDIDGTTITLTDRGRERLTELDRATAQAAAQQQAAASADNRTARYEALTEAERDALYARLAEANPYGMDEARLRASVLGASLVALADDLGVELTDIEPSPLRTPTVEPPATDVTQPATDRRGLVGDLAALPGYLTSYLKTVVSGAVHPVEHGSPEEHIALQQMTEMFKSPSETAERWQLVELPDGRYGQVASAPNAQGEVQVVGAAGDPLTTAKLSELTPAGPPPYVTHFDKDAERHVWCADGHRHWGAGGAAGVLVRNVDEDGETRYLLQLRSMGVQHGGTWSTPGGAMHLGEAPEEAGMREALEELGDLPDLEPAEVFTDEHGGWAYHTVVLDAPELFATRNADREGLATGWFTAEEIAKLRLHPSFRQSWPTLHTQLTGEDPPAVATATHPDLAFTAPMFSDLAEPSAATAAVRASIAEGRNKRGSDVPVPDMRTALQAMLARAGIPFDADAEPSMLAGEHAAKAGQTGDGAKARAMIPTVEELIDNGTWRKVNTSALETLPAGTRVEVTTDPKNGLGDHAFGTLDVADSGQVHLALADGTPWTADVDDITEVKVHTDLTPEAAAKEWKRQYNAARFRVRDARLKALKAGDVAVEKDQEKAKPAGPEILGDWGKSPEQVEAIIDTISAEVIADIGGDGGKPSAFYSLDAEQLKALKAEGKKPGPGGVPVYGGWHRAAAALEDGDAVPVRNLWIQGHKVEYGTVFKLEGTPPILVEHEPGAELGQVNEAGTITHPVLLRAQNTARAWGRASKDVKPELKALQLGFAMLQSENPKDAHWAAEYGIDNFVSAATGGDGTTTLWCGLDATVGTLSHEFGHNVDRNTTKTDSPRLATVGGAAPLPIPPASADSTTPPAELTFHQVRESDGKWAARWESYLQAQDTEFVEARHAPGDHNILLGNTEDDGDGMSGVPTDYGRSSANEDFAESVRLYLKDKTLGRLGYLKPTGGETQGPVLRFADMYPERARYLATVFGDSPGDALTPWQKRQRDAIVEVLKSTSKDNPDWQSDPTGDWPADSDLMLSFVVPENVVESARITAHEQLVNEIEAAEKQAKAEQALIAAQQKAEAEKQAALAAKAKEAASVIEAALAEAAETPAPGPLDPDAVKKIRKRKAWIKWNAKKEKVTEVPHTAEGGGYAKTDWVGKDAKGKLFVPAKGQATMRWQNLNGTWFEGKPAIGQPAGPGDDPGHFAFVTSGDDSARVGVTGPDGSIQWAPSKQLTVYADEILPGSLVRIDKAGLSEADATKVATAWEADAIAELNGGKADAKGLPGAPPSVQGLTDKQVSDILVGAQQAYTDASTVTWNEISPAAIMLDALGDTGSGDPHGDLSMMLLNRRIRGAGGSVVLEDDPQWTVTAVELADTDVRLTLVSDDGASTQEYASDMLGKYEVANGGTEADAIAARQDYIINAIIQSLASSESTGYHGAESTTNYSNAQRRKASSWLNQAGKTPHPAAVSSQYGVQAQAKANIAAELASRLNNEEDWETFRQYRASIAGVSSGDKYGGVPFEVKPFGELTHAQRQHILDQEISNRVGNWASTSADSSPWSVCMQRAVAEEFATGGDWNPHHMSMSTQIGNASVGETWDKGLGAFYRRFVRVMYEHTQEEFAAAGIERVSLFRGMKGSGSGHEWGQLGEHPVTDLMPVNSWSTSSSTAGAFGGSYTGGKMLVADFPVSRILGSARTGFGCYGEHEFVVLNGPGNVTVYQGGSSSIPAAK
jgi:HK97 family phage portal protein